MEISTSYSFACLDFSVHVCIFDVRNKEYSINQGIAMFLFESFEYHNHLSVNWKSETYLGSSMISNVIREVLSIICLIHSCKAYHSLACCLKNSEKSVICYFQ